MAKMETKRFNLDTNNVDTILVDTIPNIYEGSTDENFPKHLAEISTLGRSYYKYAVDGFNRRKFTVKYTDLGYIIKNIKINNESASGSVILKAGTTEIYDSGDAGEDSLYDTEIKIGINQIKATTEGLAAGEFIEVVIKYEIVDILMLSNMPLQIGDVVFEQDLPYEDPVIEDPSEPTPPYDPETDDGVGTTPPDSPDDPTDPGDPTPTTGDIFGLEWNQSTDTYTRLDDATTLDVTNKGTDGVKTSGFDTAPLYSEIKLCNLSDSGTVNAYYGDSGFVFDGSNGQVMLEIPKFYYKAELDVTTGDRIFRRWVSMATQDGTFKVSPSHVIGGVEKSKIYIGAKIASVNAGVSQSISGTIPEVDVALDVHRANARARGAGWELLNYTAYVMLWQFIIPIEFGSFNIRPLLGNDLVEYPTLTQTGDTDSTGDDTVGNVTNYNVSASYRGLENPWGRLKLYCDGLVTKSDGNYIETDPVNYNNEGIGYTKMDIPLTTGGSGYADDLNYSEAYDFSGIPSSLAGASTNYLSSYITTNAGSIAALVIGETSEDRGGLFTQYMSIPPSTISSGFGSRIMYYDPTEGV